MICSRNKGGEHEVRNFLRKTNQLKKSLVQARSGRQCVVLSTAMLSGAIALAGLFSALKDYPIASIFLLKIEVFSPFRSDKCFLWHWIVLQFLVTSVCKQGNRKDVKNEKESAWQDI